MAYVVTCRDCGVDITFLQPDGRVKSIPIDMGGAEPYAGCMRPVPVAGVQRIRLATRELGGFDFYLASAEQTRALNLPHTTVLAYCVHVCPNKGGGRTPTRDRTTDDTRGNH